MRPVSISQMRAAVQTSAQRADMNPPKLRLSEADMLKTHLRAADALLAELEADPTHLDRIRESAMARRRAAT